MEWHGAGPAAEHVATIYAHPRDGGPPRPWSSEPKETAYPYWSAVCSCGWTSGDHFRPPGPGMALQWQEHLHDRVPELRLHEIATENDDRGALTAEVRLLRSQGVSWERIATAVGITRQSAHQRWRHVEAELAAIVEHGPTADLARLRGALAHLGAVVDVHDDARDEIQILYGIVNAGELVAAALARTAEDAAMVGDDLYNAAIQLQDALNLAHRQAARASAPYLAHHDTAGSEPTRGTDGE